MRDSRWGRSPAPLPAGAAGMAGTGCALAARGGLDTFFSRGDVGPGWLVQRARVLFRHQEEGKGLGAGDSEGTQFARSLESCAAGWIGLDLPGKL